MVNRINIIESTDKAKFQNDVNDFCVVFPVFATQTHVTLNVNNGFTYTAILFYKAE